MSSHRDVAVSLAQTGQDKLMPRTTSVIETTLAAIKTGFTKAAVVMTIRMPIINVPVSRARINSSTQAFVALLQSSHHLLEAYDPQQVTLTPLVVDPPPQVMLWRTDIWIDPYTRISHQQDSHLCLADLDKEGKLCWQPSADGHSAMLTPAHAQFTNSVRLYHDIYLRAALRRKEPAV